MRHHRRHCRGVLSIALLIVAAGCGGQDGIDLTSRFDEAGIWVETEEIDLGTRPARQNLVSGWGDRDERWAGREDETFVWGTAAGSEFDFYVVQPDSRAMTIVGRPLAPEGVGTFDTLRIFVNGVPLPEIAVQAGWERYPVAIPTRIIKRGPNRVRMEYLPGGGGELQFAVDRILFTNATVTALPRLGPSGTSSISMPYLSGVEFDLEVEPGAELAIDELRAYGRPTQEPPVLSVRVDIGDGEPQTYEFPAHASDFVSPDAIPLAGSSAGVARLTLMVIPPEEFYELDGHLAEQDAGIEVIGGRLVGPVAIQAR